MPLIQSPQSKEENKSLFGGGDKEGGMPSDRRKGENELRMET